MHPGPVAPHSSHLTRPPHPSHSIFKLLQFARNLGSALSFVGIDAVPKSILADLTARVTATNLRVQSIIALLEIDRDIRVPVVPDRPVDTVGTGRLDLVHHAAAAGRTAGSADAGAHLVGEGGGAGEGRRRGARVDAVSQAVARGCGGPLGAAGPDLARLEDAAGGHTAGARDVQRDFGVGGVPGAVEVFELEELRF